ncbi:unnamed protein product, partial [Oikopleura dioica]
KPWTWELSGAIATFGTSGFWFALENRPSVCRKFWSLLRPIQLIAFIFAHVGVMSYILMNSAYPEPHKAMLIAMDVLASFSGFFTIWFTMSIHSDRT